MRASSAQVMDIKDLGEYCQRQRICPYFLAKDELMHADIMFLPYNYLIDPVTRKAQKIDVKNAILIFDEGHNLVCFVFVIVHSLGKLL